MLNYHVLMEQLQLELVFEGQSVFFILVSWVSTFLEFFDLASEIFCCCFGVNFFAGADSAFLLCRGLVLNQGSFLSVGALTMLHHFFCP